MLDVHKYCIYPYVVYSKVFLLTMQFCGVHNRVHHGRIKADRIKSKHKISKLKYLIIFKFTLIFFNISICLAVIIKCVSSLLQWIAAPFLMTHIKSSSMKDYYYVLCQAFLTVTNRSLLNWLVTKITFFNLYTTLWVMSLVRYYALGHINIYVTSSKCMEQYLWCSFKVTVGKCLLLSMALANDRDNLGNIYFFGWLEQLWWSVCFFLWLEQPGNFCFYPRL